MNKRHLEQLQQDEERIRNAIRGLADEKRAQIYSELEHRLKDPDTYAALNYGLVAGLHHFYLGKTGRAISELLIFICGLILIFNGILMGSLFVFGVVLIELFELFRSQVVVYQHNLTILCDTVERYAPELANELNSH